VSTIKPNAKQNNPTLSEELQNRKTIEKGKIDTPITNT
jgi:hypothetical protein